MASERRPEDETRSAKYCREEAVRLVTMSELQANNMLSHGYLKQYEAAASIYAQCAQVWATLAVANETAKPRVL